jgi:hypothetical protein
MLFSGAWKCMCGACIPLTVPCPCQPQTQSAGKKPPPDKHTNIRIDNIAVEVLATDFGSAMFIKVRCCKVAMHAIIHSSRLKPNSHLLSIHSTHPPSPKRKAQVSNPIICTAEGKVKDKDAPKHASQLMLPRKRRFSSKA